MQKSFYDIGNKQFLVLRIYPVHTLCLMPVLLSYTRIYIIHIIHHQYYTILHILSITYVYYLYIIYVIIHLAARYLFIHIFISTIILFYYSELVQRSHYVEYK